MNILTLEWYAIPPYAGNRHSMKPTFTNSLLKGIAMTGIVLLSGKSLRSGLRNAHMWEQKYENKKWKQYYQALRDLSHRGLVIFQIIEDGQLKVTITAKGKKVVRKINIEQMALPRSEHWDGVWHVVIFDVPNKKSKNRSAFTERIKQMGFGLMQKSVWAYPYRCHEEIMILRKFYEIEKHVMYIETKMVEDEPVWKDKFGL